VQEISINPRISAVHSLQHVCNAEVLIRSGIRNQLTKIRT